MVTLSRPRQRKPIRRAELLQDFTIRDFSGGWDVVDNELNLTSKFSKIIRNMIQAADGSNTVRPGTKLFADVVDHMDTIINMEYFRNHLIVVGSNGIIVKIDANGKVDEIWSDTWANNLAGSPSGWGPTAFVSFARFNGKLTVHNGLNKPVSIDSNLDVNFVRDEALNTNAFTPIGRYAHTQGRYLVVAGDPDNLSTIHISGTDETTFVGDASTDAVSIDLGSRVTAGEISIKGLGSYRDRLVVGFEKIIIPVTLGVFTGDPSVHTPTISDEIEEHGVISHRSMQTVGEDMFFADINGISSVRRATLTTAVKPEKFSYLIDPEIQVDLDHILEADDGIGKAEDLIFSIYDAQSNNYMLFVPDDADNPTETRCFVLKKIDKLKKELWAEYTGWNFTCAARSQLNRIFFADRDEASCIWIMGDEHGTNKRNRNSLARDYIDFEEVFDDYTEFTDGHGWTPVGSDESKNGVSIPWVWELPWGDNNARFNVKNSRYINFDTDGDGTFTCEMFTDNIYEDRSFLGEPFLDGTLFDDDFGWDKEQLDPALSMEFKVGDSKGFGGDDYGFDYGGGRSTRLESLYAWTAKYKIFKLRLSGRSRESKRFSSISMAYTGGSIRR